MLLKAKLLTSVVLTSKAKRGGWYQVANLFMLKLDRLCLLNLLADELKSCGTQDVFVLCTKGELLKYRVPNLIDAYQECGFCVHHYPIPDGDAPDVTTCCTILEELRSCLESNRKTIIQ